MHLISLDNKNKASVVPITNVKVETPELFMVSLRNKLPDVFLQAINAKYVADLDHLWAIIRQAWVANREGVSKVKFDLDIILRISCTSHLNSALNTVGLHPGSQDVIFVVVGQKKYFREVHRILMSVGDYSEHLLEQNSEKDAFLIQHHKLNNLVLQSLLLNKGQLSAILAEKAVITLV